MIVLVCGSRDWTDREAIERALGAVAAKLPPSLDVTVLHGAARGADQLAGEVANDYSFTVREFPADWRRYGRRAGFVRNIQMLDEQPDLVLAFQRNDSRGTQHTIDQARRRGIAVRVYT